MTIYYKNTEKQYIIYKNVSFNEMFFFWECLFFMVFILGQILLGSNSQLKKQVINYSERERESVCGYVCVFVFLLLLFLYKLLNFPRVVPKFKVLIVNLN